MLCGCGKCCHSPERRGVAPVGILLLNTGERAFWRVEERAVDEGSCCRDLSCLTLEHQLAIHFLQSGLS